MQGKYWNGFTAYQARNLTTLTKPVRGERVDYVRFEGDLNHYEHQGALAIGDVLENDGCESREFHEVTYISWDVEVNAMVAFCRFSHGDVDHFTIEDGETFGTEEE